MTKASYGYPMLVLLLAAGSAAGQRLAGLDIGRELPLEGAPLAVPGPYEVISEPAFGLPGHVVYRPADLSAFPADDTLPVVAWGNGGCAIDIARFAGFVQTVASHGFLVMSTVAQASPEPASAAGEGGRGGRGGRGFGSREQGTVAHMIAAFDWAEAENERSGSPLAGKIATDRMAAMGQSCGGFNAIVAGADPRVDTIGVFNAGYDPADPFVPGGIDLTADSFARLHGPVLLINGGEPDFMYAPQQASFEIIDTVPVFYGARDNAGHTATFYHPGGGEFANVASNWLRYVFKGDATAGTMFVGDNCTLCSDPNWETGSKRLQ